MKKAIIVLGTILSFAVPTYAFANKAGCEARAVDKDGKPLSGAAKDAFVKKCLEYKGKVDNCDAVAVNNADNQLYGISSATSIEKCKAASKNK